MPNGEEEETEEPEGEEPEEPEEEGSALGKAARDISRKRFGRKPGGGLGKKAGKGAAGKAAGKAAAGAAGKAAGAGAGAAAGSVVPGLGTAVGALVGAITSKLAEKFGPKAIKWAFYILLGIFILSAGVAIAFWGILGGGEYFGSSLYQASAQATIDQFLGLTGDEISKRKIIAEDAKQIKEKIPELRKILTDPKSKDLIDQFEETLDEIIALSDAPERRKELVDKALSIISEMNALYQTAGAGVPGLKEYVDLANSKGAKISMPKPGGGYFNTERKASPATGRKREGLHNGYDFVGPAGSLVIAGWTGRVEKIAEYGGSGQAIWVDCGSFTVIYGHVNPAVSQGAEISPGQEIATIYKNHLDIKIRSKDGRWIDYGTKPWKIRCSVAQNNSEETCPWAGG